MKPRVTALHDELRTDGQGSPTYRALLEVLREAVLTMDGGRNIRAVNPAAAELFGFEPQDTLGRACKEVLRCSVCGPSCAIREALQRTSTHTGFRSEIRRRDGEPRSVVIDAVPAGDGHVTVILRDVTPEGWQRVQGPTLSAFGDRIGKILDRSSERQMEHDLIWLKGLTQIPSQAVTVFMLRSDHQAVGYPPFVVHPSTMALELGGFRLLERTVSRYVLAGEPVLDEGLAGAAPDVLVDLFRALRATLEPTNVVFLAAVASDSALFRLISRKSPLNKDYHVVPHGPPYQRRRILMEGSYVLYAGETPITFASGYLHRKTYFGHEIGCDSAWRENNAGIFRATEILQDLFADAAPPEVFDFLHGDSPLKSSLANTGRTERHFCLFPRGFHGAMMAYPLRTVNWLSSAAGFVLQRLRLKEHVRRLRRDRSVKGKRPG